MKAKISSRLRVLFLLTLLPAIAVALIQNGNAQEIRGTIVGRVSDATGGVLPGLTVAATHLKTNVTLTTLTNEHGDYVLPQLSTGNYRLVVEQPGFKRFVREDVVLHTAERVTVNIALEVGAVDETVTVTGEVSQLSTTENTLAQTMENKRVSELPLNGRQAYMLLQLTAGVLFTQTSFGSTGFSGTRAWDTNGSVSIHGSRTGNNEFLIDGAPNAATGGWQYAPLVEAVEEFKVQASSVDASYGRTGGGVVNLSIKSGTNNVHGTLAEFHRGNALDANTTQNNRNGIPKKGHRFDSFGATVGGPIRRDKTFFFGVYEGFREHIPFPRTSTVPTLRQRAGDFSDTRNAQGQLITIYDPLTTRLENGRYVRDPFPNNFIPSARISPIAQRLLRYVPLPNVAGELNTQANNYAASPNLGIYSYDSYLFRLDHQFSSNHRIYVNNSGNWGVEFRNGNGFPPPALRGEYPKHRNHYMGVFDDVVTLNPSTLFNFRLSFDRFNDYNPNKSSVLNEDLGILTPFANSNTRERLYPYITLDGFQDFFRSGYSASVNNIYSFTSMVSKNRGAHFMKMGGDIRVYRLNRIGEGEGNGRFDFTRGFTQKDPQQGDALSGNGLASMLLGYPAGNTYVDVNASSARQYKYYALYFQDDWKVTLRLTLNLGLRWDYQAPVTERFDRQAAGFDYTTPFPIQVAGLDLRGGLLFPGVNGRSRRPYQSDWTNFQPRAGLAYEIRKGLVFRGNYGRSYLPLTGSGEEGITQSGFGRRTNIISSVEVGVPFNTLERPYPAGILSPFGSSLGLLTNVGQGFAFTNPNFKVPYVHQWMVGFQVSLPWHFTLDASYVGTRTKKLPMDVDINNIPRSEREKAIARLGGDTTYLSTTVPNPFLAAPPALRELLAGTILENPRVRRDQLLRPYPQFTGLTVNRANLGSATYDALEMTANRRFGQGLVAVFNYTLMKMFESTGFLNNGYDPKPWRAIAATDRTHRLAITALYDLPFRRGKWIGRGVSRWPHILLSGWQVNVIGEIQSGTPTSTPNGVLLQPSVKLPGSQQTPDRWFDSSTRNNPRPDGGYAWDVTPTNDFRTVNVRLSDVRDPWSPQWALSLFKNTPLREGMNLQFRFETFNALNTPIYGGPDTGITSTRFGYVTRNQINFPRHVQLGLKLSF